MATRSTAKVNGIKAVCLALAAAGLMAAGLMFLLNNALSSDIESTRTFHETRYARVEACCDEYTYTVGEGEEAETYSEPEYLSVMSSRQRAVYNVCAASGGIFIAFTFFAFAWGNSAVR